MTDVPYFELSFNYKNTLTSESFNNLIYKAIPAGIYDGYDLTKVSDVAVSISIGSLVIESSNVTELVSVKITNTATITPVTISATEPYIVMIYDWANSQGNSPKVTNKASGSILATDVVIGKGNFTGSTLDDFDYTGSPRYQSTFVGSDLELGSVTMTGALIVDSFQGITTTSTQPKFITYKTDEPDATAQMWLIHGTDNFSFQIRDKGGVFTQTAMAIKPSTGQVTINNNIASTSKDTGGLVLLNSGMGVEGNGNFGGGIISYSNNGIRCNTTLPMFELYETDGNSAYNKLRIATSSNSTDFTTRASSGAQASARALLRINHGTGVISMREGITSTSTSTGSLILTDGGGLGVDGNINSGGSIQSNSSITSDANTPTLNMIDSDGNTANNYFRQTVESNVMKWKVRTSTGAYVRSDDLSLDMATGKMTIYRDLTLNNNLNSLGTITGKTLAIDSDNNLSIDGITTAGAGDFNFKHIDVGVTKTLAFFGASSGKMNIYCDGDGDFDGTLSASGGYVHTKRTSAGSETGTVTLKKKVIEIGDWNMDTTKFKNVAHGLPTDINVRYVSVMVRGDTTSGNSNSVKNLAGTSATGAVNGGYDDISGGFVELFRVDGARFDSTDYDQTSYNRGWVTIEYEL